MASRSPERKHSKKDKKDRSPKKSKRKYSRSRSRSRNKERKHSSRKHYDDQDRNRDRGDRDYKYNKYDQNKQYQKQEQEQQQQQKKEFKPWEKTEEQLKEIAELEKKYGPQKKKQEVKPVSYQGITTAAPTMIEITVNDRLGKKERIKCRPDDKIGDIKKLISAKTGTRYDKIRLQKWYNIYKDHITLEDYEIKDGMNIEMYYN